MRGRCLLSNEMTIVVVNRNGMEGGSRRWSLIAMSQGGSSELDVERYSFGYW